MIEENQTSLRLTKLMSSTRNRTNRERNTISRLSLFNRHMRSNSMNDILSSRTTGKLSSEEDDGNSPFAISDCESEDN
jgi:hypothetical protein